MSKQTTEHREPLSDDDLDRVAAGLSIELENTLISSYSVGGATADGAVPTEQVSLNYESVKARRSGL